MSLKKKEEKIEITPREHMICSYCDVKMKYEYDEKLLLEVYECEQCGHRVVVDLDEF